MALTIGDGPFAPHPAGSFDADPPRRPLLYWEPYPKRFRIVMGRETVADSRDCLALHRTGKMMQILVPEAAMRKDRLRNGETINDALGKGTRWSTDSGDAIARSIDFPPEGADALTDHVIFELGKVDAWYLEDDLGYAHPRDPYHRVDVHHASRYVRVSVGDTVVAESRSPAILFETSIPERYYLRPDHVRTDLLVRSETVSPCPYKGDGQHWHVKAGDRLIEDACWSLTTPLDDALMIPRWFSFYAEKLDVHIGD